MQRNLAMEHVGTRAKRTLLNFYCLLRDCTISNDFLFRGCAMVSAHDAI